MNGELRVQAAPWIRLYVPPGGALPRIIPSPAGREWYRPNTYHCLPLLVAGQLGWTLLNPVAFAAVWDGRPDREGVRISSAGDHVSAQFGDGIVTISPSFYVQTSPDVSLLVKAVPNVPKDGVSVLEGLVETDWFEGAFTLNLRLTRPGLIVPWEADEPLVQLVPYPRAWIEQFRTEVVRGGDEYEQFMAPAEAWDRQRVVSVTAQRRGESVPYDGQYRRGTYQDGRSAPSTHQTRLTVPPFPGLEPGPRTLP